MLKSEGLIRSRMLFQVYSLLTGRASRLKPGVYVFSSIPSVFELTKILADGPAEISVIIAPGMTLKEIDERLNSLEIIKPGDLENFKTEQLKAEYPWLAGSKSLEGFLLPDTYSFFPNSDKNTVIHKFLDNFKTKALPFLKEDGSILNEIIIASILEKEVPNYEEQRVVAGVLIKRLNSGMPLQIDATVVYASCGARFFSCPPLSEKDYKIDSPYNTYVYRNFPPGPISNPGIDSIKAAENPKKSDYWYYLSDSKTKNTIFSKSLDEHNKNRIKYLF